MLRTAGTMPTEVGCVILLGGELSWANNTSYSWPSPATWWQAAHSFDQPHVDDETFNRATVLPRVRRAAQPASIGQGGRVRGLHVPATGVRVREPDDRVQDA